MLSISGREKTGKSNFTLTAPGPIAYANYDIGLEGLIERFSKHKQIYTSDYRVHIPPGTTSREAIAVKANEVWERYKKDIRAAYSSTAIRSVAVDTETETWEHVRMARFGQLTQVMPHHYGPVNREYRELYNEIYDTDKNLILIGRMQDEWENFTDSQGKEKGRRTGNQERKGMKDIPFLVQANLLCQYDPAAEIGDRFSIKIIDCRQNMDIAGTVLPQALCNFATLGQLIYPGTDESDWT